MNICAKSSTEVFIVSLNGGLVLEKIIGVHIERVRATLESGLSVAVIGWRDKHHNSFTRKIPKNRIIFFLEDSVTTVPERVGFLLFAPFVGHSELHRLMRQKIGHSGKLQSGEIKRILEACIDLFQPASSAKPETLKMPMGATIEQAPKAAATVQNEAEILTSHLIKETQVGDEKMKKFKEAFKQAANASGEVGMHALAKLRADVGITDSASKLVKAGWIVAHRRDGMSKVSCYIEGPSLGGAQPEVEPENPLDRAKYYLTRSSSSGRNGEDRTRA